MTLSLNARREAYKQQTGEVFLTLVEIDHADLPETIYLVNNNESITSLGTVYEPYPFDVFLPDNDAERVPVPRIRIDNVSREIMQSIRTLTTPPMLTIRVIRASEPDEIEQSLPPYTLRNVRADAMTIEADLFNDDLMREPFPSGNFDAARFPGVF